MTVKSTTGLPVTSSQPQNSPLSPPTLAPHWPVAGLAWVGALQPTPLPLTFLHKLYLKQYGWSLVYLLLGFTQIARVACALEGLWYLIGAPRPAWSTVLPARWPMGWPISSSTSSATHTVPAVSPADTLAITLSVRAEAIRTLEQLRQEGLLSEYEFEQQRRQILDLT